MAEERQPPHDEPDQTRGHQPPPDEPDQPRAHQPAAEEPAERPAVADATQMLPPPMGERWSARAGVRPSQPPGYLEAYQQQTQAYPPEAVAADEYADRRRRWWAPALVAVIALVLLGMLGLGIWLILQALERPGGPSPLPAPTTSSSASASASASPSPTAQPSPKPSPTPMVAVPQVVNVPLADAQAALDRAGLKSQVVERPDGNARPNTVVAVAPAPGTEVPVGSTVTLYVAVPLPPTSQPPTVAPTVPPSR